MWRRRSPIKIFLSQAAISSIAAECMRVRNVETGGILIGYHSDDHIVISHATGPGPKAVHRKFNIELDLGFISKELKTYEKALPVGYEGNWHCHPDQVFIRPSKVDEQLQREIIRSPDYDITTVLLLIVPSLPAALRDFKCFVFSSGWESYRLAKPLKSSDPF